MFAQQKQDQEICQRKYATAKYRELHQIPKTQKIIEFKASHSWFLNLKMRIGLKYNRPTGPYKLPEDW